MITVKAHDDQGRELASLRIERVQRVDSDWSRYSVEIAVERGGAIGLHRRAFDFKRCQGNVLGLIQVALSTLDDEDLELENGVTDPPDMARGLRGIEP